MKTLIYYTSASGRTPFLDWIDSLDVSSQVIVDRMVLRVAENGAKKSIKALKGGVFEIKIPHASGLRVYFGIIDTHTFLLLCGGDKKTQNKDIKLAKIYWRIYGQQK